MNRPPTQLRRPHQENNYVIQNHPMPFGTHCLTEGGVRFRLWAPTARNIELVLQQDDKEHRVAMPAGSDGWRQVDLAAARAGDLYCYRLEDGLCIPDPASRFQPRDVHGPSEIIDPAGFAWQDTAWEGRPWHEAVVYELHVGTFTPAGTYRAAMDRLDYLVDLGITAVELMPLADFPGRRNWGYDGVLPYAPDASYGRPEDLKAFIQAAHARGLMVLLDVVYNHFGPEGNYLHLYAPQFFTDRHHTPWGAAINYDGADAGPVRDYFIHNALYWLEEYRFDGLRLDAVHAIFDDSPRHILEELAEAVHAGPGRDRQVHLVLENDANQARFLKRDFTDHGQRPRWYAAQWNDDIHHAYHVLLTGEGDGYYSDYADAPARHLARCLGEGFAWQGEPSPFRQGEHRGELSEQLPPLAFVNFIQNHDQIGNRAFGERLSQLTSLEKLRAATAALLLAPNPPLLFMGDEFAAATPFLFFCDFGPDLQAAVRDGRRREFAQFERFSDPAVREAIPDPGAVATCQQSRLDWACLELHPHAECLTYTRTLLALRKRELFHRLADSRSLGAAAIGPAALRAACRLGDGAVLTLLINLGDAALAGVERPAGRLLFASSDAAESAFAEGSLKPASTLAYLDAA